MEVRSGRPRPCAASVFPKFRPFGGSPGDAVRKKTYLRIPGNNFETMPVSFERPFRPQEPSKVGRRPPGHDSPTRSRSYFSTSAARTTWKLRVGALEDLPCPTGSKKWHLVMKRRNGKPTSSGKAAEATSPYSEIKSVLTKFQTSDLSTH
jgi:hypothetical protein